MHIVVLREDFATLVLLILKIVGVEIIFASFLHVKSVLKTFFAVK